MDDLYPYTVMRFALFGERELQIRSNKEYDCGLNDEAVFYIYVDNEKIPFLISDIKVAMGAAVVAQWTVHSLGVEDAKVCQGRE
jgi:hypothetical protein